MYTNLYVYKAYRQYMSGRLYWRYKKNGKWTWKPASAQFIRAIEETLDVYGIDIDHPLFMEEEE